MEHASTRRIIALSAALCGLFAGAFLLTLLGRASGGPDPCRASRVPTHANPDVVVVELFTSEGCSSCPPADEVLGALVREPVGGIVVLGLGEHVDYWDHLGWRDSFSSPSFSGRQSEYQSRVFRAKTLYTPQRAVDGQVEVVGSDVSAVCRAIAQAAKIP